MTNVADYEALARERMERGAFDYIAGGSGDERTLAMNVRGFDRFVLRPRVLVDVSRVDTSATVLGERVAMPILIAPTSLHRLAHPDGEAATVRAAAATGTIMCVSTVASMSIEDVAAAASGPCGSNSTSTRIPRSPAAWWRAPKRPAIGR